jgi:ring-1,2-phenylacetyl-CoA epoxidase subunit PaaE
VAVGDVIEVMPPMGDFLIDWDKITEKTNIVLWGAGSGITPLMSIAKFLLAQHLNHVTLVYGNRDFENAIFAGQIEMLKQKYNHFTVWHFHSKLKISSVDPHVVEGRISPGKVIAVLKHIERLEDSLHYICGPVGLKESVKEELSNSGIETTRIYSEDFELIKDPKEFEEVITRSVEINNAGNTCSVEVVKSKSILEAGLDAGIELPYACQTGNCSICKGKLLEGALKMIGLNKRPADLLDNEYLLCCSYPLSENIKIEINP